PVGDPPLLSTGDCRLPAGLALQRYARAVVDRSAMRPSIAFSALEWSVKDVRWGPDDNSFSAHPDNVSVDRLGHLHLKITKRGGEWQSAEVIAKKAFGYGRYVFYLSSRVDLLNENVVVGLFTWDTNACHANDSNGEVDIEFSRWGDKNNPF